MFAGVSSSSQATFPIPRFVNGIADGTVKSDRSAEVLHHFGLESPAGRGTFEGTYWNMPSSQDTRSDSQGGSTRRCGLLATFTVATCDIMLM